jgi:RNA polymerase sigma-70 factor (ECF subfamily)
MLGSAAEAEDVVQDAYLRWSGAEHSKVSSARAYLTTTVTRLCIDRLDSARARRESYPGPWLPEPVPTEESDPSASAELADSLSLAFLVLLEELGPVERAAFLLRDVFGYSYRELAPMIGQSEANSRQLVTRARRRIGDRRVRFDADLEQGQQLTHQFMVACGTGDVSGLISMLSDDIVVWTDGGGKAQAAPRPVVGAWRSARFLINLSKRYPHALAREVKLNGQPGLVLEEGGTVTTAIVLDIVGGQISGIRVVRNPDKLSAVQARGVADA